MADLRLVMNDTRTGKSYQKVIPEAESSLFRGKKIKEIIQGDSFGLKGYEFQITGGSDIAGFPMRYDVEGQARKRPVLMSGAGIRSKDVKLRKTVAGNTVSQIITQINMKVTKQGAKSLEELFAKEEKAAA